MTPYSPGRVTCRKPRKHITNGGSLWGTLDCPTFPDYLESNPLPYGKPWALHDHPSKGVPHTGVTRYYDFTVARGILAPDGYEKSGIYVNGQFPGPIIEANWGDWIEIHVHNNITNYEEGTAIHWHGITQKGTPWFDGVPGVSQCPIAPGSSFTYRFRADKYGTSWWHSHYSAQYTAGVWGPLIIYGPKHVSYDVDLGPVMLGDYYHAPYIDIVKKAATNSTDFNTYVPWSDNSLINGKNNYNCSMPQSNNQNVPCSSHAGLSRFRFQPGKTHRLRLMNTGAAALIHFSIDGHKMRVIANDLEPVVPYEADFVTLHVAQRTDILVKADADPKKTYWMRSTISLNCSSSIRPIASLTLLQLWRTKKSFLCKNDDLEKTTPYFQQPVDPHPDTVETIEVDLLTNTTGQHVWIMNNRTQYTDYNTPVLLEANRGNWTFPDPKANVYNFGTNRTVRIVMNTVYQAVHPMHIHGTDFQVLSEGPGAWDGKTIVNPHNPLRRDTHVSRRYGHLVIQFTADNPGTWSYHCHIAWHASMGFNILFLEQPAELRRTPIPYVMDQTCVDWKAWTKTHVVDQIDSGI
ncbi:multicopper oxidase [Hypomontagnella submonticulosa]|nr:multicopper oxidase [Hypomontagnella submonticulosa]